MAIKAKFLFISKDSNSFPVNSVLKTSLSKACPIQFKTSFEARLISSKINIFPSLKAFKNAPSSFLIPTTDLQSPTYLLIKLSILVSALRLNLI